MKLRLIGQANDSGIGTHYYHYVKALRQIKGVNDIIELVDFQDHDAIKRAADISRPDDVNISFVCNNLNDLFKGTNINWAVSESTVIPETLMPVLRTHDLWIPSEWGRKIAIENGIDSNKIEVVPEGVDSDVFHPYLKLKENRPFRFLLIGKYEIRKSFNETIEAFNREFNNNSSVELIIKTDFFRNQEEKYAELQAKITSYNTNNIKLIWGYQTIEQLAELYRTADVFVMPTKAEGWGLPLIEAAAAGLPVITTFYSAQTEFLQDIKSSCVFVNYELQPIDCPEYQEFYHRPDGNYGKWAVTTVDEVAKAMRHAYTNYSALNAQAIKNSEIIRTRWSWANCAIKSLEILKKRGLL